MEQCEKVVKSALHMLTHLCDTVVPSSYPRLLIIVNTHQLDRLEQWRKNPSQQKGPVFTFLSVAFLIYYQKRRQGKL